MFNRPMLYLGVSMLVLDWQAEGNAEKDATSEPTGRDEVASRRSWVYRMISLLLTAVDCCSTFGMACVATSGEGSL